MDKPDTSDAPVATKGYARLTPSIRGRVADVISALAVLACVPALLDSPEIEDVWLRLPLVLAIVVVTPVAWYLHRRRADRLSPFILGGTAAGLAGLALLTMAMHRASGWTSLAGLLAFVAALSLRGSVEKALIKGRDLRVGERKPVTVLFENIESLAAALVLVLLVWHFGLEAFRIPSGSMAPTLLGDPVWGDRVLVDKFAYVTDDPQRWEPVVFRYPLRRGEPYVKRCIALPGEQVLIAGGDVYVKRHEGDEIELLTKNDRVRDDLWFAYVGRVSDRTDWVKNFDRKGAADFDDGVVTLGKDGMATFPKGDGTNPGNAVDHDASFGATETDQRLYGLHVVGDLRLRGIADLSDGKSLQVKIIRDADEYTLTLRAGADGATLAWNDDVEARLTSTAGADLAGVEVPESAPFAFALADGELSLSIDGEERTRLHVGTALLDALRKRDSEKRIRLDVEGMKIAKAQPANGARGRIEISGAGGGEASLQILGVDRDIYYIGRKLESDRPAELPFAVSLAEDQYFVLGDNSPGSADARMWVRITLFMEDDTEITGSLDLPTQPELFDVLVRAVPPNEGENLMRVLNHVAHFTPEERGESNPEGADSRTVQAAFNKFKEAAGARGWGAINFWTEGGGFVRVNLREIKHFQVQPHPYVQRNLFVGRPFAVFLSPRGMKLID